MFSLCEIMVHYICRKIYCFVTMTRVVVRTSSDIRGRLLSGIGPRFVLSDVVCC